MFLKLNWVVLISVSSPLYLNAHRNIAYSSFGNYILFDLGTYFGTHFIMGGERFDTPQPEAYLFGENGDLNFLGSRPTAVSPS